MRALTSGGRRALLNRLAVTPYMSCMHKTTLYLDDDLHARVQREADARGVTQALVVREAISAYVVRRKRQSKSIGLGRSGKGDVSERAEELLAGMGRKR